MYRCGPYCKYQTQSAISARFGAEIRPGEMKCYCFADTRELTPGPLQEQGEDLDHLLSKQTHDWSVSCGSTSACGRHKV